jgi:catechol 2,3-dioxygenase-like lactoylglutathione lyase family enzyme
LEFPLGYADRRGDAHAARDVDRAAAFLATGLSLTSCSLESNHTAIVVGDRDASLRFYRELLGLRVVGESENYGPEQTWPFDAQSAQRFRPLCPRMHEDAALRAIVEGVEAETGDDFFRSLVRAFAATLNTQYSFVSALSADRIRFRTLALWGRGSFTENVEAPVAGTPCEPCSAGNRRIDQRGVGREDLAQTLRMEAAKGRSDLEACRYPTRSAP